MPTYKCITPFVAYVGFTPSGDFDFAPPEALRTLDGLAYIDEDFVEHMSQPLASLVQYASGVKLSYSEESNELVAITIFETLRELDESELDQLKKYYDAQMSDGIGENFIGQLLAREDVRFRIAAYWLYDETMQSKIQLVK